MSVPVPVHVSVCGRVRVHVHVCVHVRMRMRARARARVCVACRQVVALRLRPSSVLSTESVSTLAGAMSLQKRLLSLVLDGEETMPPLRPRDRVAPEIHERDPSSEAAESCNEMELAGSVVAGDLSGAGGCDGVAGSVDKSGGDLFLPAGRASTTRKFIPVLDLFGEQL
jgi:hypothetical protein